MQDSRPSNVIDLVRARRKIAEREQALKVQRFNARNRRANPSRNDNEPPPRAA